MITTVLEHSYKLIIAFNKTNFDFLKLAHISKLFIAALFFFKKIN